MIMCEKMENYDRVKRLKTCRKNLTQELIVSEIKYIGYLRKLIKYFCETLSHSSLLPHDMYTEIFGRISPILTINETLLDCLLTTGVENAFLSVSPCLKLYADYARRYHTVLILLETCVNFNLELRRFITRQENLPDLNLQLPALMIMPIQRIPRYSLLLQELFLTYLQLHDGLSVSRARTFTDQLLKVSREKHRPPEHASNAAILAFCPSSHPVCKRLYAPADLTKAYRDLVDSGGDGSLMDRPMSFNSAIMASALVGVIATATYLDDRIRLDDRNSDVAALLRFKLLGSCTRQLLLAPGRHLLRYSLVNERNSVNGQLEPRLLVLLSDLVLYATPRKQPIFRRKPLARTRRLGRSRSGDLPVSRRVWSRPRRHRLTPMHLDRQLHKAWLTRLAAVSSNLSPVDLLHQRQVRFSCTAVYPLHHCRVTAAHLPTVTPTGFSFPERCSNPIQPSVPSSARVTEECAFTITCRETSLRLLASDPASAELWVTSLNTAISTVQRARRSLRKASSAKRPMSGSDYARYEQWLCEKEGDDGEEDDDEQRQAHPIRMTSVRCQREQQIEELGLRVDPPRKERYRVFPLKPCRPREAGRVTLESGETHGRSALKWWSSLTSWTLQTGAGAAKRRGHTPSRSKFTSLSVKQMFRNLRSKLTGSRRNTLKISKLPPTNRHNVPIKLTSINMMAPGSHSCPCATKTVTFTNSNPEGVNAQSPPFSPNPATAALAMTLSPCYSSSSPVEHVRRISARGPSLSPINTGMLTPVKAIGCYLDETDSFGTITSRNSCTDCRQPCSSFDSRMSAFLDISEGESRVPTPASSVAPPISLGLRCFQDVGYRYHYYIDQGSLFPMPPSQ